MILASIVAVMIPRPTGVRRNYPKDVILILGRAPSISIFYGVILLFYWSVRNQPFSLGLWWLYEKKGEKKREGAPLF